MAVYQLKGVVQHYAWGGKQFIPDLLSEENSENEPYAELWMGAHIKGQASIKTEQRTIALPTFIAQSPDKILGKQVAERFNQQLPFLFKVLDVHKMLSIQAHPTKKAAEIGFAEENQLGIDVTATNRTYRDDNHKPEVMVALTDFWLLHGFKSANEIEKVLAISAFQPLKKHFNQKSIFQLYKYIMEMPQIEVNQLLAPLWQRLKPLAEKGSLEKSNADYWAAQAFQDYTIDKNYDRGIFSIYLFNLVKIEKGKGIFQAAGIPHAYLEGVNMELMANSDNVFRGGLTQKHINVPELLDKLVFDSVSPAIIEGVPISNVEKVFKTPAPDFELSQINLKDQQAQSFSTAGSAAILITLEGDVILNADKQTFTSQKGTIFFLEAHTTYTLQSKGKSLLFKASVPT